MPALLLALAALAAAGGVQAQPALPVARLQEFVDQTRAPSATELLAALPQAQRFVAALERAGLADTLAGLPELTLLVPVDASWPGLPATASAAEAAALVRRHALAAHWAADGQATPAAGFTRLDGTLLQLDVAQAAGVPFEAQGLRIRNGWLHLLAAPLP